MAYIEFKDVSKIYTMGQTQIRALDHISFAVEKGELCVIVGPSGAGKTTLLNILGGMDKLVVILKILASFIILSITFLAVSYTHLDVYKRQTMLLSQIKYTFLLFFSPITKYFPFASYIGTFIFTSNSFSSFPEALYCFSLFSEDVYKRQLLF